MDSTKFYQVVPVLLPLDASLLSTTTTTNITSSTLVSPYDIIMSLSKISITLVLNPWMILLNIVIVIGLVLCWIFRSVNRNGALYEEQMRLAEEGLLLDSSPAMQQLDRRFSDVD